MNTKRVNAAAGVIARAMENGRRVPAGMAMALESAQMLMSPELAAELERLRALESTVQKFVAQRAEYITNLRNCSPDNGHDYDRWQGHAAARRQLAQELGLPVAWPEADPQ